MSIGHFDSPRSEVWKVQSVLGSKCLYTCRYITTSFHCADCYHQNSTGANNCVVAKEHMNGWKPIGDMFCATYRLLEIRKLQLYWKFIWHSIHDFIKARLRPRPRPQLTARLRPRPSVDAQKACGRVRVRARVRVRTSLEWGWACISITTETAR